ncbi:pyridoxamine 5'-phosphate oxidase family protein [Amycolatopsis dongchuanensis]|uniref:Pyridoxamine 5'-phosphate oxidase N-terminal domain-containing protein n=1 Tax=Amycolatopsis dongchuanensis TaxID=1070866 RepID=A0ABP9PRN7_9PSEU
MPGTDPSVAEIHEAITELLRTEELATLATVDSEGRPSASPMHIAGDGLVGYLHTFRHTRKSTQMRQNPNVSYSVCHVPAEGYAARWETRSLQIQGIATLVTDPVEIQRIAELSQEQFPWARDVSLYDNLRTPDQGQQLFYRIEPVQGLWADNRVRMLYRVLVDFGDGGKTITKVEDYNAVVRGRA